MERRPLRRWQANEDFSHACNDSAILNGSLASVETKPDPIFGVNVPVSCPEVPVEVLQPRNTWADKDAYDQKARELARRFNENFKKYESGVSEAVRAVAPTAD